MCLVGLGIYSLLYTFVYIVFQFLGPVLFQTAKDQYCDSEYNCCDGIEPSVSILERKVCVKSIFVQNLVLLVG